MGDIAGNRSGGYRSPPDLWVFALDAARTEKDVLVAVKDYLATWTPAMISRIPETCRPGRITGIEDVGELAFRLSNETLKWEGTAGDRVLVERMSAFFGRAASRLSRILAGQSNIESPH